MKHRIQHIHFVGVGGSGMSGIAEVLLNLGYRVSGSDLHESAPPGACSRAWACGIFMGHAADERGHGRCHRHLHRRGRRQPRGASTAREKRIPVVPRAVMLAELMRLKRGIADRRHARQDHHHQPGGQRAGRRRA